MYHRIRSGRVKAVEVIERAAQETEKVVRGILPVHVTGRISSRRDRGPSQTMMRRGGCGWDSFSREATAMARRFSVIAALSLVLCFLPCCATIVSQIDGNSGPRVFSGTRLHFRAMAETDYWLDAMPPVMALALLELSLSFAADTLILPYTVPAQLICGDFKEKDCNAHPPPPCPTPAG